MTIQALAKFGTLMDALVLRTIRERTGPFLDVSRLRINKLATGRKRELADLENLNALDAQP